MPWSAAWGGGAWGWDQPAALEASWTGAASSGACHLAAAVAGGPPHISQIFWPTGMTDPQRLQTATRVQRPVRAKPF